MKKILIIFFVITAINQNIFSQAGEKKITIQSSPLLLLINTFIEESDLRFGVDLEGQFKLTNVSNISLTLSFLTNSDSGEQKSYQLGVKPMYIIRPFETGIKGFYVGLYPHFGFLSVKNNTEDQFYFEYGFGMNIGYKWIFNKGFTMQVGGGTGKTFSSPHNETFFTINSDGRLTIGNTDLFIDFKLGYSF